MQLHYDYLLVVIAVSGDIKVMSSTVAVIFAITYVVNNDNIQTEPRFLKRTAPNSFRAESEFFRKTEPKLKLHIPIQHLRFITAHSNTDSSVPSWSVVTLDAGDDV